MTDSPDLELTLPARAENVGVVRHVLGGVAEALGLGGELLDDMRLAVSEACANAVVHAYVGGSGLMDIDVHAEEDELLISVRDHGAGMAPRTDSPGLGVGLPLMASLAGSMELLSPPGGGTEVRMRFPLPAPDGAGVADDRPEERLTDGVGADGIDPAPGGSAARASRPGPRG